MDEHHDHNQYANEFSASMPPPAYASIATTRTNASTQLESVTGNAGNQFGQRSCNIQSDTRNIHAESNRFIGMFSSSVRHAAKIQKHAEISRIHSSFEPMEETSFLELDSHADTSLAGANCHVKANRDRVCEVSPYHPQYKAIQNVPIVKAATAYIDQGTGTTYILIINQALYLGDTFKTTLINPNEMRANDIMVDDVPKHLGQNATHSIYIPKHNIHIPLQMKGIVSCTNEKHQLTYTIESNYCCNPFQLTVLDAISSHGHRPSITSEQLAHL